LEHFDGTTAGSPNGAVTYTNGVFGQGVHLNLGAWVSWNLSGLLQGTVEFWGKLDSFNFGTYDGTPVAAFIQSDGSQFFAQTFTVGIVSNFVVSSYHCGCGAPGGDWVGMANGYDNPNVSPTPIITSNIWHHYAATWGGQGFHLYLDGSLVYSNANTNAQNPATAWWAIGGQTAGGSTNASWPGFAGVIDELRISDVQRSFTASPVLSIETAAFRLGWFAASNVNYQLQWSTNLSDWHNLTSIFGLGTQTNVVDWVDGPRRFYRLASP